MQAVKGRISNGLFTPSYETTIPSHAEVILIFADAWLKPQATTSSCFDEVQKQARIEGLKKVKEALAQIDGEDLSDFPKQGLMKLPHEYSWAD